MEEFEHRHIHDHKQFAVERVEKNEVVYRNGERLGYDVLVAFPPYVAATSFPSLPVDIADSS